MPRKPTRPPSLRLDIQCAPQVAEAPLARARARRLALAALDHDATLTLRFVGRAEARALCRRFRGQDHASNVLTFRYDADHRLHADIVICVPVVRDEARRQHKSFDDHLAHLWVHGVLHAQGHDHEQAADAARMESIEIAILRRFRIRNPYEDDSC